MNSFFIQKIEWNLSKVKICDSFLFPISLPQNMKLKKTNSNLIKTLTKKRLIRKIFENNEKVRLTKCVNIYAMESTKQYVLLTFFFTNTD